MQDGLRYTGQMLGVALPAPVLRALGFAADVLIGVRRWSLMLLLFWGSATARAESEDDARARAHFVAAQAYFEDQRFSDAAREFGEAYELSGRPEMLLNRSRAEERAGALAEAVASLELLLARYPQTSYRPEAEQRLAALRPQLPPPAAEEPKSAQPAATPAPEPVPSAPANKLYWPRKPLTLVAAGGTAASLLVAIATGWAAHSKYKDLEARCDGGCEGPFRADKERGQRLARTSTGFTFAALALGGLTTALYIFELRERGAQGQLSMRSSPTSCEANLRLSF